MNKWFGVNGLENAILRYFIETKQQTPCVCIWTL